MSHGVRRNYDPLRSPLELPIRVVRATLVFERPFDLPEVAGATLGTSLRGALGHAIRQTTCPAMRACRAGTEGCAGAPGCSVPVLWDPRSEAQRRQHASPIALATPTAVAQGAEAVDVRVVLWGRAAIAGQMEAWAALRAAGGRGLDGPRGTLRFEVDLDVEGDGTIAGWAEEMPRHGRAQLAFGPRSAERSEPARTAERIADAAHDLVQWDLFDRGDDEALGKRGCDALADAARAGVRERLGGLTMHDGVVLERAGLRRSGRNEGGFELERLAGAATFEGELGDVGPWLAVAALRGVGPKRGFGSPPALSWEAA